MIETLARAIYVSDWGAEAEPWDPDLGTKQVYFDRARAVLKALETPTPEMIEAAKKEAAMAKRFNASLSYAGVFEAMIRAAQEQADG